MEYEIFEVKFANDDMAHTLDPEEVCENHRSLTGASSRTHVDGWTISGSVCEDYFYWVNDFEACHPIFGRVAGNFEEKLVADSKEAYDAFYASHGPSIWDYGDI